MSPHWIRRTGVGLAVAAGATAVVTLIGSPAMASPVFCGASRGRTAQVAHEPQPESAHERAIVVVEVRHRVCAVQPAVREAPTVGRRRTAQVPKRRGPGRTIACVRIGRVHSTASRPYVS